MMARHPRARSLSSTGHYAAGCITVTLLAALSLILLRSPAAERRCDLSSYDPASTEALDLKRCKLSTLPVAIAEFRRLKKLDLGFPLDVTFGKAKGKAGYGAGINKIAMGCFTVIVG